jgi:uncharacterized protein
MRGAHPLLQWLRRFPCWVMFLGRTTGPRHESCLTYGMSATVLNFPRHMGELTSMKRADVLLAALVAPERRAFAPVHLQKTLFLIDYKLPRLFKQRYAFQPYDYGPFDKDVYADADALQRAGLVAIVQEPGDYYRTYRATANGLEVGQQLLAAMPAQSAALVRQIANLVTRLGFRELVTAIYESFPEMKVNSVFKEHHA